MIDESTKTITIGEFNTDNYDDDRQSAGYICERDELWGCPDDYFMVHYSFLFKVDIDFDEVKSQENQKGNLA